MTRRGYSCPSFEASLRVNANATDASQVPAAGPSNMTVPVVCRDCSSPPPPLGASIGWITALVMDPNCQRCDMG
jgi:hypothetical protein